jgi:hypothetical protein
VAVALMLFVSLFYLSGWSLPTGELAIFLQKAVAMSLFILIFMAIMTPSWQWPLLGFTSGLSILLILDMICLIAKRWSLAHGGAFEQSIHYAFPIASNIGYSIWLYTCWNCTLASPVQRSEMMPALIRQLTEYKDALRRF